MNYLNFFENYSKTYKKKFPDYYEAFDLKEVHSKNVSIEALNLGKKLGLNENDLDFCQALGLFHDMGRFPQYAKYQTFNDLISCDHGKLSCLEAIRSRLIFEFEKNDRDIFLSCLFFHNKKDLPVFKTDKKKSLFLKILKDADKLDIFRVVIENYLKKNKNNAMIQMNFKDSNKISSDIVADILNNTSASIKSVNSLTDLKLFQLSWIFDFHFKFSLDEVKKRKIPQKIFSTIPESIEKQKCFDKIKESLLIKIKVLNQF
ncbi:MAG: HD domain-containing protein [Desulforegulaceae bacterium]|nr:HD domain-containing protein [Desulforegulaceae bacterium]